MKKFDTIQLKLYIPNFFNKKFSRNYTPTKFKVLQKKNLHEKPIETDVRNFFYFFFNP